MDRLTARDFLPLWLEELGWSQDIGALAILDGSGLLDADGRFRIERALTASVLAGSSTGGRRNRGHAGR